MKLKEFITMALLEVSDYEGDIDFDIAVYPSDGQVLVATDHLAGSTAQGLSRIKFTAEIEEVEQEGSDE